MTEFLTEGNEGNEDKKEGVFFCQLCHKTHHAPVETCACNCCKLSKHFIRLPKPEELLPTAEELYELECLQNWQELSAKSPRKWGAAA